MSKIGFAIAAMLLSTTFTCFAASKTSSVALSCMETTTNVGIVPANSSIAIQAPACPADYTVVSGGCSSSNPPLLFIASVDTNVNGYGCSFISSSLAPESVSAYARCCTVK